MKRVGMVLALWCAAQTALAGLYQEAVEALGFQELETTFSAEKVEHWLEGDNADMAEGERRALAVLRVLGAPESEASLARYVAEQQVVDAALLGYVGEPSLYTRLEAVLAQKDRFPRSEFSVALRDLIRLGVANGYNIVTTPWPAFDPERHIVYGHSNARHARQLMALLASEGLSARVGLSLKTSAFLHRPGWGPVSPQAIALGDERYLNEAMEYDLHFELAAPEDKARFMAVINEYAKKEEGRMAPLIAEAWWQPFYCSRISDPAFHRVARVEVSDGNETAMVLVLTDKAEALKRNINALERPWQASVTPVWVNPAFYRYLQGGFQ
ncbi:hypothetical protein [Marinimicrobium sp. ARAG 43.8]|uniref:hypothetical protein n=1 Tax=Marinimicrobium sp. ARAG 43.8 TaxID=3418719 RepID=UPI003CEB631C